ncbi:MCM-domain-containing protein [Gonapodya prolifera JEL478]|uniref:MCM-domain-containing protein n=1 Tax=Gonapodya prolifera (strain JEL478) TaxID=1344416 RepID=A0A139A793_GONPJ|nr:MCM-domain-containing protein [Gonapodya prolifera JEL478]|eukprot:KXS12213.1 MCM-domain-containing protein [Gonapodya prolifera JEL478]
MEPPQKRANNENSSARSSGSNSYHRAKGKSGVMAANRAMPDSAPAADTEERLQRESQMAELCEKWTKELSQEIVQLCRAQLVSILHDLELSTHFPVYLSTLALHNSNPRLSQELFFENSDGFRQRSHVLEDAVQAAQFLIHEELRKTEESIYFRMKEHVHLRLKDFHALRDRSVFFTSLPRSSSLGSLISLRGTVVRAGMAKVLEYEHLFECAKCHGVFRVRADREEYHVVKRPSRCGAEKGDDRCDGTKFRQVEQKDRPTKDYQEIKIQENVGSLTVGRIPRSMTVILEDDLVDSCKPGDDVAITGTLIRRFPQLKVGERADHELVLFANYVHTRNHADRAADEVDEDVRRMFEEFWTLAKSTGREVEARNLILASFCPRVFGLYFVKLAILLVLMGGVESIETGSKVRGDSHLLLVGDPGTGKSQFLRHAALLVPRAVLTTGVGSTNAGLTVTAVRESGEWQLEAGALVLADRGVCCIDEFGSVKKGEQASVLEAMEQQTISVAKAGIVAKLLTRCSVLAATNPKGSYDPQQSIQVNTALNSPLISRFDLVLVLIDGRDEAWDRMVSSFILSNEVQSTSGISRDTSASPSLWSYDLLRLYVQYCRSKFKPKLNPEAEAVLKSYFLAKRKAERADLGRTTVRLLESLIRLSQAHAKLMFRDSVTLQDAVVAVHLMECSVSSSALLGFVDDAVPSGIKGVLRSAFPEEPDDDYRKVESAVLSQLGLKELIPTDPQQSARTSESPKPPLPTRPSKRHLHQPVSTSEETKAPSPERTALQDPEQRQQGAQRAPDVRVQADAPNRPSQTFVAVSNNAKEASSTQQSQRNPSRSAPPKPVEVAPPKIPFPSHPPSQPANVTQLSMRMPSGFGPQSSQSQMDSTQTVSGVKRKPGALLEDIGEAADGLAGDVSTPPSSSHLGKLGRFVFNRKPITTAPPSKTEQTVHSSATPPVRDAPPQLSNLPIPAPLLVVEKATGGQVVPNHPVPSAPLTSKHSATPPIWKTASSASAPPGAPFVGGNHQNTPGRFAPPNPPSLSLENHGVPSAASPWSGNNQIAMGRSAPPNPPSIPQVVPSAVSSGIGNLQKTLGRPVPQNPVSITTANDATPFPPGPSDDDDFDFDIDPELLALIDDEELLDTPVVSAHQGFQSTKPADPDNRPDVPEVETPHGLGNTIPVPTHSAPSEVVNPPNNGAVDDFDEMDLGWDLDSHDLSPATCAEDATRQSKKRRFLV